MSNAALKVIDHDSISLDAIDKHGKPKTVRLKAQIIGPSLKQQQPDEVTSPSDLDGPQSRADDDEGVFSQLRGKGLITPPYNLTTLAKLREQSTELGQNIQTMVTNIVGFGWQLREIPMPEDVRKRFDKQIQDEKFSLLAKLRAVHPVESLTAIREREHWDKHAVGGGYLEQVENKRGELVGLNHVHGHSIRITVKSGTPARLDVPVVRPDRGFMIEEMPMLYRFRKFVQIRRTKSTTKPVWFKEAGDTRQMDWRDGMFAKKGEEIPFRFRATSLIHNRLYNPTSPYGLPLYIGNLFSIFGSREAENVNYNTMRNNAVPSMMILVENGQLTSGSIERLKEWTEEHIQRAQNYSTFLLLEAESMEEGSPQPGSLRIRIEPLKNQQQQDELFQKYDLNNRDKIRQSFRLPPIFVGRADDFSRATADTSRDIADEQIFAPERTHADWMINRFVLPRWGARFHIFRSNHPNITDDIELIRLMAIAEKSGAMTPRRADRIIRDVFGDDIGPMPEGINLDQPFTITFAQAQQGISSDADATANKVVKSLANLRLRIEKELDSRYLLDSDGDDDGLFDSN